MKILKFNTDQNIPMSESLNIDEIGSIDTIKKINAMFQLMKKNKDLG